MLGKVKDELAFSKWSKTAHVLDPPYDYFDFAGYTSLHKQLTNVYFSSIMKHYVTENPNNSAAIEALCQFQKRTNAASSVGQKHEKYWKIAEEQADIEAVRKRKLDVVKEINDDVLNDIVYLNKKTFASSSTGHEMGPSEPSFTRTPNNATTVPTPTNTTPVAVAADIIHNISYSLKNYPIVTLDEPAEELILNDMMGKQAVSHLKNLTKIPSVPLTDFCQNLIQLVVNAPPSAQVLHPIIKTSTLVDTVYDPVVHADLRFSEKVLGHFLDLTTSPRNPLIHKSLERTAACYTTAITINALFLQENDIIDLEWFERILKLTGPAQWDGICL